MLPLSRAVLHALPLPSHIASSVQTPFTYFLSKQERQSLVEVGREAVWGITFSPVTQDIDQGCLFSVLLGPEELYGPICIRLVGCLSWRKWDVV